MASSLYGRFTPLGTVPCRKLTLTFDRPGRFTPLESVILPSLKKSVLEKITPRQMESDSERKNVLGSCM